MLLKFIIKLKKIKSKLPKKIESRLPGGYYFNGLCSALLSLLKKGRLTIKDIYIFLIYFIGAGNRYCILTIYNYLIRHYSKNDHLDLYGIKIPKLNTLEEKGSLVVQFLDFVFPYFSNDYSNPIGEGPYLYNKVKINTGDIVIDAGANIGMFSALASRLGAIVYAFEPIEKIREKCLKRTVSLNSNINIIPLALSNKKEKNVLMKGGFVDASMISKFQFSDDISEEVSTITLDEWVKQNNIPRIDFIKADIEGAERLMLEGAQWVLKTYAPKLAICTYHLPDDKEVLTKLILQANPNYKIEYAWVKLYAWVEK